MTTVKRIFNFPPRVKMLGLNPYEMPVKLVSLDEKTGWQVVVCRDLQEAQSKYGVLLSGFTGPMFDTFDSKPCLRFESEKANDSLSS